MTNAYPDRAPGQQVGSYRLLEKLGEGGFGEIWKAEGMGQMPVVLKMALGASEDYKDRFQEEVRVLRSLNHPHIIGLMDSFQEGDRFVIVQQYVESGTVAGVIRDFGRVSLDNAVKVIKAVASALDHAHQKGMIHRDIKPANILIPRENGELDFTAARLTDFGVAGQLHDSGETKAGFVFGTPSYMAPEQIQGLPQSAATDIYGLGVLFFEMIYGVVPFSGKSFHRVMYDIINTPVNFLENHEPDQWVKDILSRCLEKDPKDRYASAQDLLNDLRHQENENRVKNTAKSFGLDPAKKALSVGIEHPSPPNGDPTPSPAISPQMALAPSRSSGLKPIFISGSVVFLVAILLSLSGSPWFVIGGSLVAGSPGLFFGLRTHLRNRKSEFKQKAQDILNGEGDRELLSTTMAVQVDELLTRVNNLDERIMAQSIALMLDEYEKAGSSQDRQSALMNSIVILEKLTIKMSPWYVRHEKALTFLVAFVTLISGVITLLINAGKLPV